jgi:hypothetical protein
MISTRTTAMVIEGATDKTFIRVGLKSKLSNSNRYHQELFTANKAGSSVIYFKSDRVYPVGRVQVRGNGKFRSRFKKSRVEVVTFDDLLARQGASQAFIESFKKAVGDHKPVLA